VRPLPVEAAALLETLGASPRLVAHLTLVHDVACTLIASFEMAWPSLSYDRDAVRLGAAIHDIGKIVHPEELAAPGHLHESAGEALLQAQGWPKEVARFARTHHQWGAETTPHLENCIVALADTLWRGRRDASLETAFCAAVAQQTREPAWQVFLALDEIASRVSAEADLRLAWHNQHAVEP
jgi:putative nucleotidyltransferase with HDIG domain